MKNLQIAALESSAKIVKWEYRRLVLKCWFCPPNRGENIGRKNQYEKKNKNWKLIRKNQWRV